MSMMDPKRPTSETPPLQSPQHQQHPPPPPPPPSSSFVTATVNTAIRPRPRPPSVILSFTNGALKRHPLYRECLRNHAATLGGHAVDGCGEFMPSPLSSPSDPTSLKCAACGCHRNFHRRDDDPEPYDEDDAAEFTPTKRPRTSHSPPPLAASPARFYPSAPHMLMALSAGLSGPDADNVPTTPNASLSAGRKRFRTKFSKEQKERMQAFSEKLGWKMQKKDEKVVEDFCNEIGVGRGVLKVWMHNNKHTFAKRDGLVLPLNTAIGNVDENNDNNNNNNSSNAHLMNGSSSSS